MTAAPPSVPSAPPAVGAPAPDFSLPSTAGAPVALSSFRGTQPVLLAFFPAAFTSVCTEELCGFTDEYDAYAAAGVRVLPISVDAVPSLREYKAKHALRTDLLSDFRREVSRAYGVLNEARFASERAYFLIDRDGVVRWSHVEVHGGFRRGNAEILAEIAKL